MTQKHAPTLENFCDLANDLYAAPTEARFLAVVNLAREVLAQSSQKWDDGYRFARSAYAPLSDDELERMWEDDKTSPEDCQSLYYFKVVARAVEVAHGIVK